MELAAQGLTGVGVRLGRVPESDETVAVIAKLAQRRDVQHQARRDADVGTDPCRADRAEDVPVGEGEHETARLARERKERLRPLIDLGWGLAARTAVLVNLPARVRLMDLPRGLALIVPVVDLPQEIGDLRVREAGELSGSPRPLHRARVDSVEMD